MDKRTKKALLKSIEHWKENETVSVREARVSSNSCALCHLFANRDCIGCPVHAFTGHKDCAESPWRNALRAAYVCDQSAFSRAAAAERQFLESLLPSFTKQPAEGRSVWTYKEGRTEICKFFPQETPGLEIIAWKRKILKEMGE